MTDDLEEEIDFSDFNKVDIRSGTIISVKDFPKAKNPSYQLYIDFGEDIGIKKSSAQITDYYSIETLLNRQIMAVVNFPPRQIADFMSEVLILGSIDEDGKVVLVGLDRDLPNGQRLC